MKNKEFINIILKEVFFSQKNINLERFCDLEIDKTRNIIRNIKKIFNKLDEKEKETFLLYLNINTDETISSILSIVDQWGGGYYDDGKYNDGHFELYYVSDEEGKYSYRVDEDSTSLFLEKMEEINENKG
ncbi:hypothetical protein ACH5BK_03215 [Arcobacter sp. YIC-80]|uniref:hypothetical protein n=1 Tax=Arcobacter sp. YIC-80 TaxID=3376683 RepID=UPI00384B2B74